MSFAFSGASSLQKKALLPAMVGLGLLVFGFLINRQQFFVSYLVGYLFAVAFPMGCMILIMVHNLSGGKWGWSIRPFLESGMRTMPFMALLFIPVALGMTQIYPWTNHELVAHDAALQSKEIYLNPKMWLIRAGSYFAFWTVLAWWLRRWLLQSPESVDFKKKHRLQRLSAGGLLLFILSGSFAAIDWSMSIEPHWFSSIYGGIILLGCAMSAFAVSVASMVTLNKHTPNPWMTSKNLHDLGKFLFMTVMVWGYFNLSQFLIIWSGNLPEETFWYFERSQGWWGVMSGLLPILQWALPFCLLLGATGKKNPRYICFVALYLIGVRFFEQIWLVAPSLRQNSFPIQWMDLAAGVGLGSLWAFLYFGFLSRNSGVPTTAQTPAGGPQDHVSAGGKH